MSLRLQTVANYFSDLHPKGEGGGTMLGCSGVPNVSYYYLDSVHDEKAQ